MEYCNVPKGKWKTRIRCSLASYYKRRSFLADYTRNQLRQVGKAVPPDEPNPCYFAYQNVIEAELKFRWRILTSFLTVLVEGWYYSIWINMVNYPSAPCSSTIWDLQQAHSKTILCTQKHCVNQENYQHLTLTSRSSPIWRAVSFFDNSFQSNTMVAYRVHTDSFTLWAKNFSSGATGSSVYISPVAITCLLRCTCFFPLISMWIFYLNRACTSISFL